MVASMYVELQPWITLFLDGSRPIELPRERWIDGIDYTAVGLHVEIVAFQPGTGSASLSVQTAANDDARAMIAMKDAHGQDSTFSSMRAPAQAAFMVPPHSASPLRRWIRWTVDATDVAAVCFRITALLHR